MAFATTNDVAARLGRDLSVGEQATVTALLDGATAFITASLGLSDDWADALSPVPRVVETMTVELTVRSLANPNGLKSLSENLGQFSYTAQFNNGDGSSTLLTMTKTEELLIRRAIFGRISASPHTESVLDDIHGFDTES